MENYMIESVGCLHEYDTGVGMKFEDMIKKELIFVDYTVQDRDNALSIMAECLHEKGYVKETYLEAVLERERIFPSGLPMEEHKIAIPHTDSDHVNRSAILFMRLKEPVEFGVMGAPEEKIRVKMISMLALKEKKEIGKLLETLINVYQKTEIMEEILKAPSGEEIYQILNREVGQNSEV